jgi:glycosyltransferase involved in cell wall biosynthesis
VAKADPFRPSRSVSSAQAMRRPVAMIAHAYYDEDPRVRREAEALTSTGREVDVFALRRPEDPPLGTRRGVRIHRLDIQRRQGAPLHAYLREYIAFLWLAARALTAAHRRRRYGAVQVHTIPDFLVFAAVPLKLAGVPVILDLHEAMPEFFRSRFPRAANGLTTALLSFQEVVSLRLADAVITVNEPLSERFRALGVPLERITVVHNSPSLDLFDARHHHHREFMEDGSLRLVYAGALTPNYELDVLLDAVAVITRQRPTLSLHLDVYGRGDSEPALRRQAEALGLNGAVTFHGRVPLEDMAAAIARVDVGLAPIRRNAQTELSLPTKLLEYAAMGKPAVASDLATVSQYLGDDAVATYRAGDSDDLARAVLGLVEDAANRTRRLERSMARLGRLSWEHEAAVYVALIDRLVRDR